MASAFEFYNNKKKKPKALQLGAGPKRTGLKASTPLPQSSAQLFIPSGEASASQILPSPILNGKVKKKKLSHEISTLKRTQGTAAYDKGTAKEEETKSVVDDSVTEGKNLLAWIVSPVPVEDFFSNYWEQRPLYIKRDSAEYFKSICTLDDLFLAFKHCPMHLLKNVTVTSYENGKRTTDGTPGRARVNLIKDYLENGHSIRILNPQTFVPNIGSVVACLQEFFRCMVGVNSYLTPAGTQGFAPHYDDIEAFVLQLDGEKLWKVYPPRSEMETLPRLSSPDFDQNELGEPMLEVTLKAGDLLYFPRGFIHQARSVKNQHSLHLTISSYQCNTWGDFFKIALPMALDKAIEENVELREGLPLDFLDHLGAINPGMSSRKKNVISKASQLFSKIIEHCPWDNAADQVGKEFIHSAFPPQRDDVTPKNFKKLFGDSLPKAQVRLITAHSTRLAYEEKDVVIYYSTDNSLEPRGEELLGFSISEEEADVFRHLKTSYPNFSKVSQMMNNKNLVEEAVADLLAALAQRALIEVNFPVKDK